MYMQHDQMAGDRRVLGLLVACVTMVVGPDAIPAFQCLILQPPRSDLFLNSITSIVAVKEKARSDRNLGGGSSNPLIVLVV